MQFFTLPVFALLATSVLAMPSTPSGLSLETRVDTCKTVLPLCDKAKYATDTNCRCNGQQGKCKLWWCPGDAPNVMVCGDKNTGCVWI